MAHSHGGGPDSHGGGPDPQKLNLRIISAIQVRALLRKLSPAKHTSYTVSTTPPPRHIQPPPPPPPRHIHRKNLKCCRSGHFSPLTYFSLKVSITHCFLSFIKVKVVDNFRGKNKSLTMLQRGGTSSWCTYRNLVIFRVENISYIIISCSFNFVRSPYHIRNSCESFIVKKYSCV